MTGEVPSGFRILVLSTLLIFGVVVAAAVIFHLPPPIVALLVVVIVGPYVGFLGAIRLRATRRQIDAKKRDGKGNGEG